MALHENLTSLPLYLGMLVFGVVRWNTGLLPKAGAVMAAVLVAVSLVAGLRGMAPRAASGQPPWPRWFTLSSAAAGLFMVLGAPVSRVVRIPIAVVVVALAAWLLLARPRGNAAVLTPTSRADRA